MKKNAPRTQRYITSRTRRERAIYPSLRAKEKERGICASPALCVKNRTLPRQQRAFRVSILYRDYGADNTPYYPKAKAFHSMPSGFYRLSCSPILPTSVRSFRSLSCCFFILKNKIPFFSAREKLVSPRRIYLYYLYYLYLFLYSLPIWNLRRAVFLDRLP